MHETQINIIYTNNCVNACPLSHVPLRHICMIQASELESAISKRVTSAFMKGNLSPIQKQTYLFLHLYFVHFLSRDGHVNVNRSAGKTDIMRNNHCTKLNH